MPLKAALLTAVAFVGLSTSAHATTTIITYQGTVQAGSSNDAGLFGGGSLDGLAFTAAYTLTLPTPGATDSITGDDTAGQQVVYGNSPANPLTASITINGYSLNVGNAYGQSERGNDDAYGNDTLENFVEDISGTEMLNIVGSTSYDFVGNLNFSDPLSYNVHAGDITTGVLRHHANGGSIDANFDLINTSVTVQTLVDAVPEPASWALMLGGLALAGLAMRRRQPVSVGFA